jgi:hypothetical protein
MRHSTFEARTIFRQLGAGEVEAQLATQWAHHKPITSQPAAVPSEVAVRLVQKGLNSVGCAVKQSGKICPLTAQCLEDVSGPDWKNMTWLEHGKSIIKMRQLGRRVTPPVSLPAVGLGGTSFTGSLGAFAIVGFVILIALKKK